MSGTRVGRIERVTKESSIEVQLDLDGTGVSEISTGVGFYDHMLDQLARHGLIDLRVKATGDLHIDIHHVVEDTAIALGQALKIALGDKTGIRRFADVRVPLDETLAQAVVDLSGRAYLVHSEPDGIAPMVGNYDMAMTRHIWEAITANAMICLHVDVPYGRNAHHVVEAQFKAVARALRFAAEVDPRMAGVVPSTKGTLSI